jgi:hypothetical protein
MDLRLRLAESYWFVEICVLTVSAITAVLDDAGEIFDPYLQRLAAFWQATVGRLRLHPAKTCQSRLTSNFNYLRHLVPN